MLLNDDDGGINASPRSRRQSRRDTIATDNGQASPSDNRRRSMASRTSHVGDESLDDTGSDGQDEDVDIDQGYAYDNGPMDDGGGGEDDEEDADEDEAEADVESEDDRVQNSDEDTGEETAVERPQSKVQKVKSTKTTKPKQVQRRRREDSDSSDTSPIKRARVSGFPLVPGKLLYDCVCGTDEA